MRLLLLMLPVMAAAQEDERNCADSDFVASMSGAEAGRCVRGCGSLAGAQLKLSEMTSGQGPSVQMYCAKAYRRMRRLKACIDACPDSFAKRGALHSIQNAGYSIYCQDHREVVEVNVACLKRVIEASRRRCSSVYCISRALEKAKNAVPGKLDVAVQMCSHRLCHLGCMEALLQEKTYNCTVDAPVLLARKAADSVRSFLATREEMDSQCGGASAQASFEPPQECRDVLAKEAAYLASGARLPLPFQLFLPILFLVIFRIF